MGRRFSRCPVNVDAHTNPFHSRPEDLSEDKWYLTRSGHNGDSEAGSWKPKGGPRPVKIMGLELACWVTIRVFSEVDGRETDWVMLQYNVTTAEETVSICKIGKDPTNHVVGDPFPLDDCRHIAEKCPFLAAGIQYASRVFSDRDYLELDDLI